MRFYLAQLFITNWQHNCGVTSSELQRDLDLTSNSINWLYIFWDDLTSCQLATVHVDIGRYWTDDWGPGRGVLISISIIFVQVVQWARLNRKMRNYLTAKIDVAFSKLFHIFKIFRPQTCIWCNLCKCTSMAFKIVITI